MPQNPKALNTYIYSSPCDLVLIEIYGAGHVSKMIG